MDNSYTNKSKDAVGSRSIHPPYDALLKDNMRKSFPGKHIISKQNNIFLHSVDYGVLLLILQVYTKNFTIIQVLPIDSSRARLSQKFKEFW